MGIVQNLYTNIDNGLKGLNKGLSTGLPKLDEITGGVQRSTYYTIFGLSGTGKSALLSYCYFYRLLKDNPNKDILIILYSLEVSAEIVYAKLLSLYLYETYGLIVPFMELLSKSKTLTEERYKYVLMGKEWLESIENKFIVFDKALNAKKLYHSLLPILQSKGILERQGDREVFIPNDPEQLIVVALDHASILNPSDGRTLKQEMDLVSQYLLSLRNKYGISPVVLMQQNREASTVERRKMEMSEPELSHTKDSSNIVQDSEIVLAVYSPIKDKCVNYRGYKVLGEGGLGDVLKSVIVLKNRYGIADKVVPMAFMGSIGKFEELPKYEDIVDISYYQNINKELNNEKDLNIKDESNKLTPNKVKFSF